MIVDEQIEALESDDFSKGNHQIVKFKEMVRMLLLTMLHSLLLIIKPRFILMAMQDALLSDIKMQRLYTYSILYFQK